MNKKAPIYRTCIATRKLLLKSDLYRIVKYNGRIYLDLNQDMPGRGAYISKDLKAITLAHDKHLLAKALKCEVKEEIFLELISALSKEKR